MILMLLYLLLGVTVNVIGSIVDRSSYPWTLEQSHIMLDKVKKTDPYQKEKRLRFVCNDIKHSPLLEKGSFQWNLWQKYQTNPFNSKIADYMFYKTKKYALEIYCSIAQIFPLSSDPIATDKSFLNERFINDLQSFSGYRLIRNQISCDDFVLTTWVNLYSQLKSFYITAEPFKLFTPRDAVSFSFLFAFIRDIAYFKVNSGSFGYVDRTFDLLKMVYDNSGKIDAKILFAKLFSFYKEGPFGAINLETLKQWYGGHDHYIFPIFNRKGTIGIATLLDAITLGTFVLVGLPWETSFVHNGVYQLCTELIFHDLAHGRLVQRVNKAHSIPKLTTEETYFRYVTHEFILPKLICDYKKAIACKDSNTRQDTLKCLLTLFFLVHENLLPSELFVPRNRAFFPSNMIQREVAAFLGIEGFDIPNVQKTLFLAADMLNLYSKAYPPLADLVKRYELDGLLNRNNQTEVMPIDKTRLMLVMIQLQRSMLDAYSFFYEKYDSLYGGTLPFLPAKTSILLKV